MRRISLLHPWGLRPIRKLARLVVLLTAIPLAACTDQLVDPAPEPLVSVPPAPSFSFAPPVSGIVAAADFAIPGSNTVNIGATAWFDIGYTVEEPGWVEMRTSGEVEWKINPAGYKTACGLWCIGSDVLPYYGEGTTGGAGLGDGALRSHLAARATRPEGDSYGAGKRTSPDGQVYALVPVKPGTRLWAARSGMSGVRSCAGSGSCGEGMSAGPTGWYLFESRMEVQVRKVKPIQVQPNKTSFEPGEALTWKTVLYEGVGDLSWAFEIPGELPIGVPCMRQTECVWAPPYPGRMRVTGRLGGVYPAVDVAGHSDSVTNQAAKLKLTCTSKLGENRVTRGETINCTASKDPLEAPGELKVSEWTFVGEGRSIKAEEADQHSLTWGGTMVVSGTVSVAGMIGGRAVDPATATVHVVERTWTGKIKYPDAQSHYVGEPELPYPPVTPADLELRDGVLGEYLDAPPVARYGEGSGPNRGWVYVDEPPAFSLTPLIHLNIALRPQDPFYRAQRGESGLRLSGRPPCGPAFMQQAARHVPAHEDGHHQVAKMFYEASTTAELMEQRKLFDPTGSKSTAELFSELIEPLRRSLKSLQDAHDESDELAVPCSFTPVSR